MFFTRFLNWATPLGNLADALTQRKVLGIADGCAMRRQGRCPGKEYCADCAWNEGCMVDGTFGSPSPRPK